MGGNSQQGAVGDPGGNAPTGFPHGPYPAELPPGQPGQLEALAQQLGQGGFGGPSPIDFLRRIYSPTRYSGFQEQPGLSPTGTLGTGGTGPQGMDFKNLPDIPPGFELFHGLPPGLPEQFRPKTQDKMYEGQYVAPDGMVWDSKKNKWFDLSGSPVMERSGFGFSHAGGRMGMEGAGYGAAGSPAYRGTADAWQMLNNLKQQQNQQRPPPMQFSADEIRRRGGG